MSHDFAKKKKAQGPKKTAQSSGGLPAWFWMLAGVVTGLFIAFLVYLANLKFDPSQQQSFENEANNVSKQIKQQADRLREGKELIKKPRFEFYERLPEVKIETPKPEPRTQNLEDKKAYLLQVGSFRSFQDADSLKAQLIMQGLDVQVKSVEDEGGKAWHRVQVGPYQSQHQLNKAQDVLAENNIPSILMEAK